MFNIYEYHNSFTASSYLKHSFNTFHKGKPWCYYLFLDKTGHEEALFHPTIDYPSLFIDEALSQYDLKYYYNYEDIEEPNIKDFSFENEDGRIDPNFVQPKHPFIARD